ncbi:MAG: hypothetical protein R2875_13390 [Desulfobacterales bacterium]
MGALTTTAKKNDDGTYSISGNKIFITCGEHNLTENLSIQCLPGLKGAGRHQGDFPVYRAQNLGE